MAQGLAGRPGASLFLFPPAEGEAAPPKPASGLGCLQSTAEEGQGRGSQGRGRCPRRPPVPGSGWSQGGVLKGPLSSVLAWRGLAGGAGLDWSLQVTPLCPDPHGNPDSPALGVPGPTFTGWAGQQCPNLGSRHPAASPDTLGVSRMPLPALPRCSALFPALPGHGSSY